jgi:hypothetical protein
MAEREKIHDSSQCAAPRCGDACALGLLQGYDDDDLSSFVAA